MIKRKAMHKTQTTEIYEALGTITLQNKEIILGKGGKNTTLKMSFKDYKVEIPLAFISQKEAKNNIGKRAIIKFFEWLFIFLISNFLGGYIGHVSEPVYKYIDTIFLSEKQTMPSTVKSKIQTDTKDILWNKNIIQNYIDNAVASWGQILTFKTNMTSNIYYQHNRIIYQLLFWESHKKTLPP